MSPPRIDFISSLDKVLMVGKLVLLVMSVTPDGIVGLVVGLDMATAANAPTLRAGSDIIYKQLYINGINNICSRPVAGYPFCQPHHSGSMANIKRMQCLCVANSIPGFSPIRSNWPVLADQEPRLCGVFCVWERQVLADSRPLGLSNIEADNNGDPQAENSCYQSVPYVMHLTFSA